MEALDNTESVDNKCVHPWHCIGNPFFLLDPLQVTYLSQTYYSLF
jgi:hypothetical protein